MQRICQTIARFVYWNQAYSMLFLQIKWANLICDVKAIKGI